MRKYQQLLLLILSCFSVTILLIYKSENNRLKYILQVVNFFGRSDVAMMHLHDNATGADALSYGFVQPLPVWQVIGDNFFAYSAFWNSNDFVAGGDALALVAGKTGAVVNFSCFLLYDGGRQTVQGKFRFQLLPNESNESERHFTAYIFICRTARGHHAKPESVQFKDSSSQYYTVQSLRLHYPKSKSGDGIQPPLLGTICLDLVNSNSNSSTGDSAETLKQFFLHHYILGFEDIIVYNGDAIPHSVIESLSRLKMRLYVVPFNFPFSRAGVSERVRAIIKTDCLMRNVKFARNSMLLEADEFFYPRSKLSGNNSVLRSINNYPSDVSSFHISTYAVCINRSQKLLMDNTFYDPEIQLAHKINIYRPKFPVSPSVAAAGFRSVDLPVSTALVHKYVDCVHVGKDGLYDWRNLLREDFMEHLQEMQNELKAII